MSLYHCITPNACFGIETDGKGTITKTAPIAKKWEGKTLHEIIHKWFLREGFQIEKIK